MTLHEEFKFNRGETEWRIYFHGTKVNTQSFPWINAANSVIRLINTQFLTYGSGFTTYLRATHEPRATFPWSRPRTISNVHDNIVNADSKNFWRFDLLETARDRYS